MRNQRRSRAKDSGRPSARLRAPIQLRIPANVTTANIVLELPASENAVYDIGGFESRSLHEIGDGITYGKLMAEARRLNAHAIINIVVDWDDVITETTIRRHVEANHVDTRSEAIRKQNKLISVEPDPNGGLIYVETVRVTNRTYTGIALAIQYAPPYPPVE
jgi:uncharacterized protein YbjQ (UPF0145 family)